MLKSMGDTLRPHLASARVLDLYAGEGRFGILALEQGASYVDLVEKNAPQARRLKELTARWNENSRVHCDDVAAFLQRCEEKFHVVFADPPFEEMTPEAVKSLALAIHPRLDADGIFLVKHPSRMIISASFQGYTHWKSNAVGDAGLSYFIRAD